MNIFPLRAAEWPVGSKNYLLPAGNPPLHPTVYPQILQKFNSFRVDSKALYTTGFACG